METTDRTENIEIDENEINHKMRIGWHVLLLLLPVRGFTKRIGKLFNINIYYIEVEEHNYHCRQHLKY